MTNERIRELLEMITESDYPYDIAYEALEELSAERRLDND